MNQERSIIQLFPQQLRGYFETVAENHADLSEIRIRCMQPVMTKRCKKEYYLNKKGQELSSCKLEKMRTEEADALCLNAGEIESIFNHICQYSPYAFAEELRQGFLTVAGGHRIGVTGQVLSQPQMVKSIRNIRFLNIRISHEIKGAADTVLPYLYADENLLEHQAERRLCSTLIIAPPGVGKTTLLRDIVRQISNGNQCSRGMTVGVVDERSEIAGCFLGEPQNEVGIRTDVLDQCPKAYGMEMLLRSMSPQVIAVDEIAQPQDVQTLLLMMHCGLKVIATVHGRNTEEIKQKPYLSPLFENACFERLLVLRTRHDIEILDADGTYLKKGGTNA